MIDYEKILQENPTGILATENGGKLDARVVRALAWQDGRVYFCTHGQRPLYAQLQANPNAVFCTHAPDYAPVLTLSGKAVFVDDRDFKIRMMEESDIVKRNYQTPDNPDYTAFCLELEEVKSFSFAEGTKRWTIGGELL